MVCIDDIYDFSKSPSRSLTWSIFRKAALTRFTTSNSIFIRPWIIHTMINFGINAQDNSVCFYRPKLATMAVKPGWCSPGRASSNTVTFPTPEQRSSNDRARAWAQISQARRGQQSGRLLFTSHALWEFTQAKFTWNNCMTKSGLWINFLG